MKTIRHPNCVFFYGAGVLPDEAPFLVIEYCELGSLRTVLDERHDSLKFQQRVSFCMDIARGMEFLHRLDRIHRDLKCENSFVTARMTVKVGDFGTMRLKQVYATSTRSVSSLPNDGGSLAMTTVAGTVLYMAPELLRREVFDHKIDVYRCGFAGVRKVGGCCVGCLPAHLWRILALQFLLQAS
eukprot:m.211164 g.211164  ORF g.211164 m.211164 type:complete len:184 (+) comp10746_c0_seq4:3111-3662(+)